jgi:hypothetical protein
MISKEDIREEIGVMGDKKIVLIAIEEMAELSKALLKNVNRGKDNRDDVFEETADVSVMLEFLKAIYNISDADLWEYIDRKHAEKWRPRVEKLKMEAADGCEN